ncbi:MAG: cell division protein FtsZ [Elusimicrobiota bacterium]
MVRIRCTEEPTQLKAVIKVIGLGGAGGNAVNRMVDAGIRDVERIAANTDAQDLRRSRADIIIQMGESITRGLGVGGDPEKGRLAALESKEHIREVLQGADLVFVTAGMGGGTGTGSAPIAAQIAREANALTIGVVTRPFHFEGQVRANQAEIGIKQLRDCVDTLLVIPNDRLFDVIDEGTSSDDAFRRADEVLRQAVQSISDVITTEGNINMDLNDIKAIMTGAGEALMGVGESEGPNRSMEAAQAAITSPLLENVSIDGAKGLIVNFVSSRKLVLADIREAMDFVSRAASPEAKIKFGQAYDEAMGEKLRVTVIATGFPPARRKAFSPFGARGGSRLPYAAAEGFDKRGPSSAPSGGPSSPRDWNKPAFMRWKVRKLK